MNISTENNIMTPAQKYYKQHLENVRIYQQKNKEKMRIKCKTYNENIKINHPDIYLNMLEKKKIYYNEVTKPKLLLQKQKLLENKTI